MSNQYVVINHDTEEADLINFDAGFVDASNFIAGDESTAITMAMDHIREYEQDELDAEVTIYKLIPVKTVKRGQFVVENVKNVKKGKK